MNADLVTLHLMQLPAAERARAELWDAAFRDVTEPVTESLRAVAARLGAGYSTALRKWYAWKREGVAGLVRRAKGPRRRDLSPEFIAWWKQLCQENGRKCKPAYRKFVALFKSGALIPGIGPEITRFKLPRGYTYENLIRHAPTRFELLAARQGLRAADNCRPLVFTTRKHMHVGQEIVFDDLWHDFEVVVLGQKEPSRLLQLCAMDVFSGCLIDLATKPRVRRETDGTRENVSETEALFYVAHVLEEHGYFADGARLIVEAGTMTLSGEVCEEIHRLSGGRVIVHVGKTSNAVAFAGQYGGQARGNFRLKAMLESWFNLLHNETADVRLLPGQTGSNARINAPEELTGRRADVVKWLQTMPALPDELRRQIRLGLVEYHAADRLVREITERINRRIEHDLEGYVEAGLTTVDYELPGIGLLSAAAFEARLEGMPPEQREPLKAFAVPHPRKMSPREVYNAGRRRLVKFRPEQIAKMLYAARRAEPVNVGHDHLIALEDKLVSPEPLRFLAHTFRPGDKFDAVLNPWAPDKLHLFDARGCWVGIVNAWRRADRTDTAAIEAQVAEAERIKNLLRAPVRKRGMEVTLERLADTHGNIGVLDQHADGPATRKTQANAAKFGGDAGALLGAVAESASAPETFSAEGLL